MQAPFTAKHPAVTLIPFAKLDVAADEEKSALANVVEALVMEKSVEVAKASEEEPSSKLPFTERKVQCLASVPAFMSVRVSWPRNVRFALVVAICRSQNGVVVPIPTLYAKVDACVVDVATM